MTHIVDTYLARTPGSAAIDARARRVMPGGDTRAVAFHTPYPLTITRAEGPFLWDVDGNRYVDLLGNYTSLVHGNAYPPIVDAAQKAVAGGSQWAARNTHIVELAEMICDRVPSVERVRFTNSGSEATVLAVEMARHLTGRRRILMARYGYHGSSRMFEIGTHGDEGPDTLLATYGDADDFAAVLQREGGDIAAVIVEPVLGAGGVITPPDGFLPAIAAAARRHGALFIMDEVITLRLGTGGVQQALGLEPDLTTMGKVIGGGFPVGAVGGKETHMAITAPDGPMSPSGTFNGNPVTAAAGVVSLSHLTVERIERMATQAVWLADAIEKAASSEGLPATVTRNGSLLNLYLGEPAPGPIRDDGDAIARLHMAMLNHGVFAAPRGMMALSTVLDDQDIAEAADGIASALADVGRFAPG